MVQFQDFEKQVGFSVGSGAGTMPRNSSRIESMLAESSRLLKAGDTDRFNALLEAMRLESAPPLKCLKIIDASDWIEKEPPPLDPIIEDMFETTDKVALIGASKLRKSFFALQLALHLAAGMQFVGWMIPKRRKVLLVQLEMKASHFHRRLRRMAHTLGITRAVIDSNLQIINGRGTTVDMDAVAAYAKEFGAEIIIFDPLYKLLQGDENSAADMKPVLAGFDRLAEATGAAIMYVHHDAKGNPADRNVRDRGAGSNVLGRDYDCCITMTAHRDNTDAVVIEVLQRNYKPQFPFTIGWCEGSFRLADLAAVSAKGGARPNPIGAKPAEEYCDEAAKLLSQPVSMAEFIDLLKVRLGLTQDKARSVKEAVLRTNKLKRTSRRYSRGGPIFIGHAEEIDKLEARLSQPELPVAAPEAPAGAKSGESDESSGRKTKKTNKTKKSKRQRK
jgi:hypothetical protein